MEDSWISLYTSSDCNVHGEHNTILYYDDEDEDEDAPFPETPSNERAS